MYIVPRVSKEISLMGAEACVCCIKRGSPESVARCLVQAAGQGEPGIVGKRKRRNTEKSDSKWTVKNFPDSRELAGFVGTDAILLSVLFFREGTNSVLNIFSQPLWLPDENSPPRTRHPLPLLSVCLHVFFFLLLILNSKSIS